MEDIWNYRAQLPSTMKIKICPPDGIIFSKSALEIRNTINRESIKDYILTDINKFNNAISDSDKKTGFMYFLIGLGHVSTECYNSYSWLITG